ncbi:hypothetical protein HanRHA438_Chr01g0031511 [Helianthus annuus]|nr:hypothetical protein HanRHA438_Chr01g0031511 [Helianthus annuus]
MPKPYPQHVFIQQLSSAIILLIFHLQSKQSSRSTWSSSPCLSILSSTAINKKETRNLKLITTSPHQFPADYKRKINSESDCNLQPPFS